MGPRPSGVLLRAELRRDRALVALTARGLIAEGLAVAVLKRRLGWVAERRALFGALQPEAGGGIPRLITRQLAIGLDTATPEASAPESDWGPGADSRAARGPGSFTVEL
jgi:hypothetical protein